MGKKVITRLSKYKNALNRFKKLGFVKVFSDNLADAVGVTPSQVRKDFSIFGITGNKRGGYKVEDLLKDLYHILGKENVQKVVVVGAGNIGSALMNYPGFCNESIEIIAGFDADPAKTKNNEGIPVFPIEKLQSFVHENNIKVGILAVPEIAAQHVADIMISSGIKGILNFAPIQIRADKNVIINSVNLALELENICYFVNSEEKENKDI